MTRRRGGVALWRRLAHRRAAIAVMFALTILPILGFVALAFDVGSVVWERSQLDLAADVAALAGASTGANDFASNPNTDFRSAQRAEAQRFYAEAGTMPGVTVTSLSLLASHTGGKITATVTYTASYRTQFASLFGFPMLQTTGTATAGRTNSPFFDIEFLLDDSSSMAIGASQSDMSRLGTLVANSQFFYSWGQGQNCAFGCHFDASYNDFYGMAKANGVSLRIDLLRQAVQGVIQTISQSPSAAQFEVGVRTFNTGLNTVYATSADLTDASVAVGNMTVPLTTDGGDADTNIPYALSSITAALPAAGDGSSQAQPRRILFIVSDGVSDFYDSNGRELAPLDPTQCAGLKANNIQVMTLYTQYFPLEPPYVPQPNGYYQAHVKPFVAQVFPNMQACASSPSDALQASDGPSISAALGTLLQQALATPARFTQ